MKILYKSRNAIVIHKPAGISSQPDATGDNDALTETSRALVAEGEQGTLYPIHRLDKVVSGLLIFARNRKSAAILSALVSGEGIGKEYLAVTDGIPPAGVLTDYLSKDTRQNKAVIHTAEREGAKRATLTAHVLATADTPKETKSLVRVRLDTGRFHQIRAQLSHRGAPITGDSKYGSRDFRTRVPALHAFRLTVDLDGEQIDVTDLPDIESYPWNIFPWENYTLESEMRTK